MTATSQDVLAFKAQMPEFASTLDADIAAALDEVDMWLDEEMWLPTDYPWARRFLAAHHLKLAIGVVGGGGSSSSSGSSGSADVFVRMVAFGERRVMWGERKGADSKATVAAPGEEMLEDTVYGQKFLRLRNRNFPGVMTV